MFGVLYAAPESSSSALEEVARDFSPRIELHGAREIGIDLHGVSRLFGDAREVAHELRRTAADRGLRVRVAIAGTRTAARLLVRHRAGLTIVERGTEAAAVALLPLALLDVLAAAGDATALPAASASNGVPPASARNYRIVPSVPQAITASSGRAALDAGSRNRPSTTHHQPPTATLRQWGLRTLGEFAALAPDEVAARLGYNGVWWQRIATGEDPAPLVPAVPEERFEQALDLEWPIDGLEPLSFVLGRLMEPLSAHLERRDRGAAVLHVRLHLVTRTVHERSLQLPVAMRDPRTLRTLALLDLESNPPAAAIDRVVVAVDPTPARIVQYSLLTRPLPSPEQISTLMARLTALMGDGRCGAPALVDSWQPGAFAMAPFAPREVSDSDSPFSDSHWKYDTGRRGGGEINEISDLRASVPLCVVPAVNDAASCPFASTAEGRLVAETTKPHDLPASPPPRVVPPVADAANEPVVATAEGRLVGETTKPNDLPASPPRRVVPPVADAANEPVVATAEGRLVGETTKPHDLPASPPRRVVPPVADATNEPVVSTAEGRLVAARPELVTALRRFRFPIPARVRVEDGKPVRVMTDRRGVAGGRVETCAGPWRTSGAWWLVERGGWDCDEWDVTLADGATYRLSRHRDADQWFVDGVVD